MSRIYTLCLTAAGANVGYRCVLRPNIMIATTTQEAQKYIDDFPAKYYTPKMYNEISLK